jgi:hypothetical protein
MQVDGKQLGGARSLPRNGGEGEKEQRCTVVVPTP